MKKLLTTLFLSLGLTSCAGVRPHVLPKPCLAALPTPVKLGLVAPPRQIVIHDDSGNQTVVVMLPVAADSLASFATYLSKLEEATKFAVTHCVER